MEEKIKKIEQRLKLVTARLSDCKKEHPTTSTQKLKWRKRLQRLKRWRIRLFDEIDRLEN